MLSSKEVMVEVENLLQKETIHAGPERHEERRQVLTPEERFYSDVSRIYDTEDNVRVPAGPFLRANEMLQRARFQIQNIIQIIDMCERDELLLRKVVPQPVTEASTGPAELIIAKQRMLRRAHGVLQVAANETIRDIGGLTLEGLPIEQGIDGHVRIRYLGDSGQECIAEGLTEVGTLMWNRWALANPGESISNIARLHGVSGATVEEWEEYTLVRKQVIVALNKRPMSIWTSGSSLFINSLDGSWSVEVDKSRILLTRSNPLKPFGFQTTVRSADELNLYI